MPRDHSSAGNAPDPSVALAADRHALSDRRIAQLVIGVVGAVAVAVCVNLYVALSGERRELLDGAAQTARNLARVIDEQARGSVDAVDIALASIAVSLRALPVRDERGSRAVHALLQDSLRGLPFVRAIWVLDAHGDMIHDTDDLPGRYNLADRPYFRALRDGTERGLRLDPPIPGIQGRWFVAASRRIDNPDGSFWGVAVAAIEPKFFERVYGSIAVGEHGVLAMTRLDSTLIARAPPADEARGQPAQPTPAFVEMLRHADAGVYRASSTIDGVERIYAYRRVGERPLVVIVGSASPTSSPPGTARRSRAARHP